MADILIDVEVRGNQKVTTAVKNVQTLQTNVKRLSDAMSKGSLSQRQYYKGIAQLAEATGKSEKELRDYATALRRVEKETKAAKAAQDQEREAVKAYAQARREAIAANQRYDAELKKKAKSEEEAARAAAKHASEMEQIKNKYVPLYAASKQYERALEEINQANREGILTDAQREAALENLNSEFARLNSQNIGNTRSMNAMGMATQQVGYQVGDFLVQVQSGTNAMVAFGQQATQLVGVLPMMAEQFGMNALRLVRISAVLGIAIPLVTAIGAAIMRTREAADEAAQSTETLAKQLENALTKSAQLAQNIRQLQLGVSPEELAMMDNIRQKRQEVLDAEILLEQATGRTKKGAMDRLELAKQELETAESQLETLRERESQEQKLKSLAEDQAKLLQQELDILAQANQWRESNLQGIRDLNFEQNSLIGAADEYVKKVAESFQKAQDLKEEIGDAAYEALRLAGVDMTSGIDAAAKAAGRLMANLGVSLAQARNIMRLKSNIGKPKEVIFDPRDPRYDPIAARMAADKPGTVSPFDPSRLPKPSGGGGGGGSAKTQEDYVGKLLKEAEQKRKLIGLSEEETRRQEILYQLKERGLPTDDKRIEQIIQMEAETRKLMEAEQQREQMMNTITSNIESAFMSVVDGSKSVEDAFKGMLRNIILAIYQQQVAQPAATAIGDIIKSFFANGGAFSKGVQFYAKGDVFNSPTAFQHSGGLGVMGEAGPEAIMPLKRGKNGKLGVQMEGSSGDVVIHQNFNFSANGDDSVKRIIRGEIPRITEATKAAVVDAKRRGGSYGRSF